MSSVSHDVDSPITSEQKQKWIEALRSGEYKKGTGALVSDNRYCCLGVLQAVCDVQSASGCYLRVEAFGHGRLLSIATQNTLANLNDSGRSFDEIADYIEKNISCVTAK